MIKDLKLNKIEVKGISKLKAKPEEFIGNIEFGKKENGIYFSWKLKNVTGDFLGMKADLISNRIILSVNNTREFVINYAIKSIELYQINRKRVFEVTDYSNKA